MHSGASLMRTYPVRVTRWDRMCVLHVCAVCALSHIPGRDAMRYGLFARPIVRPPRSESVATTARVCRRVGRGRKLNNTQCAMVAMA